MKAVILAALTAGAIGLYGTASVSAAPVNGFVIGDAVSPLSLDAYYYRRRWRYYRPYRYRYYRYRY